MVQREQQTLNVYAPSELTGHPTETEALCF